MTSGHEQPKDPPASGSRVRGSIDAGETRDKVPGSDPATAPLGTDDEAAGTPVSARQSEAALRQETGRGPGTAVPPQASSSSGAGSRTIIYAVGALVLLVILILIAL